MVTDSLIFPPPKPHALAGARFETVFLLQHFFGHMIEYITQKQKINVARQHIQKNLAMWSVPAVLGPFDIYNDIAGLP